MDPTLAGLLFVNLTLNLPAAAKTQHSFVDLAISEVPIGIPRFTRDVFMKLTIDNLDGAGVRDYTTYVDTEQLPKITRVLNRGES